MSAGLHLGTAGFSLIAVCYGFARFAFGLFLPQIEADLSLSSTLAGVISGGAFLGYCIAVVLSAHLTERVGARLVATSAAVVAGVGMLGIACSPSTSWLAASVMLAGSSAGLASPPMAAAVATVIRLDRQNAANTFINAGTSAGVVLSGPVALVMSGEWRFAFTIFAAVACLVAISVALSVPSKTTASMGGIKRRLLFNRDIRRLIAASFLTGACSTTLWTFGGQLVLLRLGWRSSDAGLLWIAIGTSGIVGAGAGILIARLGVNAAHRIFLGAMATGILMVGSDNTTPALTLGGGALFGAAYIMLTGVYLVWGVTALQDRPATGLMVGFLTLAIGQTVGASAFGLLVSGININYAVPVFTSLAFAAGLLRAGTTGGRRA